MSSRFFSKSYFFSPTNSHPALFAKLSSVKNKTNFGNPSGWQQIQRENMRAVAHRRRFRPGSSAPSSSLTPFLPSSLSLVRKSCLIRGDGFTFAFPISPLGKRTLCSCNKGGNLESRCFCIFSFHPSVHSLYWMVGFRLGAIHRGHPGQESEGTLIQGAPIFFPALLFLVV